MLEIGDRHQFTYVVPADKTVPHLYPESPEFAATPPVFATGYMVGLLEWACMTHLHPHLSEDQATVGIQIETTHTAATAPGMTVTVDVEVTAVSERRVSWKVTARDDVDPIGEGTHTRAIIARDRFMRAAAAKADSVGITFPAQ